MTHSALRYSYLRSINDEPLLARSQGDGQKGLTHFSDLTCPQWLYQEQCESCAA